MHELSGRLQLDSGKYELLFSQTRDLDGKGTYRVVHWAQMPDFRWDTLPSLRWRAIIRSVGAHLWLFDVYWRCQNKMCTD